MTQEDDQKKEQQFGFTLEGEAIGYVSLDQARVLAIRHARENTAFYVEMLGSAYAGVNFVWDLVSQEENEDYNEIKLSFWPVGRFRGEPGLEHFIIDKIGTIELRQILDEPSDLGATPQGAPSEARLDATQVDMPLAHSPIPTPERTPSSLQLANFEFLRSSGSKGSGDGQFSFPAGLAVDGAGEVYVVDESNHRLQVFDAEGKLLRQWGSEGTDDGQFDSPQGVALNGAGLVYVADTLNDRMQVFNAEGRFLARWGSTGTGDGQFEGPIGVAVEGTGLVYVTDRSNERVQVFDAAGRFLPQWGSEGTGDGQFKYPGGIAVDAAGRIYIADRSNHRVQVFDSEGRFLVCLRG